MALKENIENLIQEKNWEIDDCNARIKEAQASIRIALNESEYCQARFIPGYANKMREAYEKKNRLESDISQLKYLLKTSD